MLSETNCKKVGLVNACWPPVVFGVENVNWIPNEDFVTRGAFCNAFRPFPGPLKISSCHMGGIRGAFLNSSRPFPETNDGATDVRGGCWHLQKSWTFPSQSSDLYLHIHSCVRYDEKDWWKFKLVLVYGTYGSKENMITDKQIYSNQFLT